MMLNSGKFWLIAIVGFIVAVFIREAFHVTDTDSAQSYMFSVWHVLDRVINGDLL